MKTITIKGSTIRELVQEAYEDTTRAIPGYNIDICVYPDGDVHLSDAYSGSKGFCRTIEGRTVFATRFNVVNSNEDITLGVIWENWGIEEGEYDKLAKEIIEDGFYANLRADEVINLMDGHITGRGDRIEIDRDN